MVKINYNLKRLIERNIRMLKAEYGHDLTVYKLATATTNLDTGVKTATHTSQYVSRAIVLPVSITRQTIQTISIISANKQLLQGGTFDAGIRTFIIDRKDVPTTFVLAQDDWIVYDGRRYDIKSVEEYEYNTAWVIQAKEIKGVEPQEDIYVKANGYLLTMNQTATAVIA